MRSTTSFNTLFGELRAKIAASAPPRELAELFVSMSRVARRDRCSPDTIDLAHHYIWQHMERAGGGSVHAGIISSALYFEPAQGVVLRDAERDELYDTAPTTLDAWLGDEFIIPSTSGLNALEITAPWERLPHLERVLLELEDGLGEGRFYHEGEWRIEWSYLSTSTIVRGAPADVWALRSPTDRERWRWLPL